MNNAVKAIIGVFASLVLVFVVGCSVVVSINNTCVRQEAGIKAQYKENQNNYDNYFKRVKEMIQVPQMYTEKFKEMYDLTMKARYGAGGSKANWQWLKEMNPNLDPGMWVNVQRTIEAGRVDFESNQKMLLDKKRIYEDDYLKAFPSGAIAGVLGFPKMDIKNMDIVTSEETEKAFKEKKSEPIKL